MPSETDLANDALGQIGQAAVTAMDDTTVLGSYCLRFYPTLRDAALTMAHWSFAKARAVLAAETTPPPFQYGFRYKLPDDCLKLIEYNGSLVDPSMVTLFNIAIPFVYKVEGRSILTNDGVVAILYLKRETNPDVWTPQFYQGLAAQLAGKLAYAVLKDEKKGDQLWNQGYNLLARAAASDGQQSSVEPLSTDNLLWGRS